MKNNWKGFFLKLTADAVRDANSQCDSNGMIYSRIAMIQCSMGLGAHGTWLEEQPTPELQEIILKHRPYFERMPVDPANIEYESEFE